MRVWSHAKGAPALFIRPRRDGELGVAYEIDQRGLSAIGEARQQRAPRRVVLAGRQRDAELVAEPRGRAQWLDRDQGVEQAAPLRGVEGPVSEAPFDGGGGERGGGFEPGPGREVVALHLIEHDGDVVVLWRRRRG